MLGSVLSTQTHMPPLVACLERLRISANVSDQDWFDILDLQWKDYRLIKKGLAQPPLQALERVADHFGIPVRDIAAGQVDFRGLLLKLGSKCGIPEKYGKAAYGRVRTSQTSLDFLDKRFGWRVRHDALMSLGVSESALENPFAPISMNFITDLSSYLRRRQFQSSDIFAMGSHTYAGNKDSIVGKLMSQLRSSGEVYEFFFSEAIKLFERNCIYTITRVTPGSAVIEVVTDPQVAAESGVRHLGSCDVCSLKAGMISHLTLYLGLPSSSIVESACVHKGDSVCRFEVDFSLPEHVRLMRACV